MDARAARRRSRSVPAWIKVIARARAVERRRRLVRAWARAARACRAVDWAAAARRPALSPEYGHAERARLLSRCTRREDLEWAPPRLTAAECFGKRAPIVIPRVHRSTAPVSKRREDDAMSSEKTMAPAVKRSAPPVEDLLERYGCGPIQSRRRRTMRSTSGISLFDNVVDLERGRPAGALRGRRPLRAGHPLAAVAAHGADVRPARTPSASTISPWSS